VAGRDRGIVRLFQGDAGAVPVPPEEQGGVFAAMRLPEEHRSTEPMSWSRRSKPLRPDPGRAGCASVVAHFIGLCCVVNSRSS